jgi:hypothetical protein
MSERLRLLDDNGPSSDNNLLLSVILKHIRLNSVQLVRLLRSTRLLSGCDVPV